MTVLAALAWVFFKIGLFSWGGGLVIIPVVEREVVWKYGWLTEREFVDAVTLGQVSPGPVIISAAFIGARVDGTAGAVTATIAVILPSLILVCLAAQAVDRFRSNRWVLAFFHGARAAVIATVFDAALSIGRSAVTDPPTCLVFVVSLAALLQFKVSPVWLLAGTALVGLVL